MKLYKDICEWSYRSIVGVLFYKQKTKNIVVKVVLSTKLILRTINSIFIRTNWTYRELTNPNLFIIGAIDRRIFDLFAPHMLFTDNEYDRTTKQSLAIFHYLNLKYHRKIETHEKLLAAVSTSLCHHFFTCILKNTGVDTFDHTNINRWTTISVIAKYFE